MATLIIGVLLLTILILATRSTIRKIRSGCCESGDGGAELKKIRVADRDPSHYPYKKMLEIEGMTCGNCIKRVQNGLNALNGVYAKVTLGKATVLMKSNLPDRVLRETVSGSGYTLSKIDSGDAVLTSGEKIHL